jgi:hypothetical protein
VSNCDENDFRLLLRKKYLPTVIYHKAISGHKPAANSEHDKNDRDERGLLIDPLAKKAGRR